MKQFIILTCTIVLYSHCTFEKATKSTPQQDGQSVLNADSLKAIAYYNKHNNDTAVSASLGSVSKGELLHGVPVPFFGKNYRYFDINSYLNGRCFVHTKVRKTMLEAYKLLQTAHPDRMFYIMECSNKNGGKMWPHRTHQNGLSVDFMIPKLKNKIPDYSLDTLGSNHYWLSFDNDGKYSENKNIKLDFDLMAEHILQLQKTAKKYNGSIKKVILKIELKDNLFSTKHGKSLQNSGIYFAQSLTPVINNLHDDHYHIDFKFNP